MRVEERNTSDRGTIGVKTIGETRYSSKIIKAGALLPDTKAFLLNWDDALSMRGNLARIERENLLGKASRSRTADILASFRQRISATITSWRR